MKFFKQNFGKAVVVFFLFTLLSFLTASPVYGQGAGRINCAPSGCTTFGGPLLSFVPFVPFCGAVITVGPPRPIVAAYSGSPYLYNPPVPTIPFGPARPGSQNVLGMANNFNPNPFCPLPLVATLFGVNYGGMGVSFPSP